MTQKDDKTIATNTINPKTSFKQHRPLITLPWRFAPNYIYIYTYIHIYHYISISISFICSNCVQQVRLKDKSKVLVLGAWRNVATVYSRFAPRSAVAAKVGVSNMKNRYNGMNLFMSA